MPWKKPKITTNEHLTISHDARNTALVEVWTLEQLQIWNNNKEYNNLCIQSLHKTMLVSSAETRKISTSLRCKTGNDRATLVLILYQMIFQKIGGSPVLFISLRPKQPPRSASARKPRPSLCSPSARASTPRALSIRTPSAPGDLPKSRPPPLSSRA